MSNLIKSNFIAFSKQDAIVIDANKNKIIQAIDANNEIAATGEESMEEALAEAMIRDAELEGVDFGDDVLTFDTASLPNLQESDDSQLKQISEDVLHAAKQEADEIVNKAHDEAEQLRAQAYDESEQIKQSAQEEGYQKGYQEALAAAQEEIARQQESLRQQQQDFETEIRTTKDNLMKETETKMVEILCEMISNVTGILLDDYQSVLFYMVNHAMEDMDDSKNFVIKVSSEDYKDIVSQKENIYGAQNPNISIEIFEDAKLEPLQCLIETENGIVDLSLDVQLKNLKTALKLMIKD